MMAGVRAVFRVVEIHKFGGRRSTQRLVRMQSTQVTDEIFAGQFDLIVPSLQMMGGFEIDAEVMVDVRPMAPRTAEKAAAAPIP
jgi:hypothetical protein